MKSMTTCLKLGRFSFCASVRFLAYRPDKKQHKKYTDNMSEKLVSRVERDRKMDQAQDHVGFEIDPMDELVSTYEQASYERRKMHRSIFMKKYAKDAPETSLLTWQAKQQIIYLCTKENWSPGEIAESFPISAKNVQKLLHNKNQTLTPSEIIKHDKRIMKKWQRLLEAGQKLGEGPIDPELKEIVESERLKLLHNAAGAANLPVPVMNEEQKQEADHLDMYTFHYINAELKPRELKKKSRFDGQFIKMYRLFDKDLKQESRSEVQVLPDKVSKTGDQTKVIEKEAEKLKLLQALARHCEYKDGVGEECGDLLERNSDSFYESEDSKDDNTSFQNEWFAPPVTKNY